MCLQSNHGTLVLSHTRGRKIIQLSPSLLRLSRSWSLGGSEGGSLRGRGKRKPWQNSIIQLHHISTVVIIQLHCLIIISGDLTVLDSCLNQKWKSVEPLEEGYFETGHFVLCQEVVSSLEVRKGSRMYMCNIVPFSEGPSMDILL